MRIDSGFAAGRNVPGDYDSMFAKLIVSGANREQARRRMLRALDEFVVEGVPTTIPVHRWILESPAFRDATHTTTWLEKALPRRDLPAQGDPAQGAATKAPRPRDILVEVDGRRVPVRIFDERREASPRAPSSHGAHHGEHVHGEIRAPMQGTIVKVLVEKGQPDPGGRRRVHPGGHEDGKPHRLHPGGRVTDLPIRAGQVVETGQILAVID